MASPSIHPDVHLDGTLRFRAVGLSLGLASVFSLLGWRLVNLHVGQGDAFQEEVRVPLCREVIVPATRGAIFDRQGEVLAADRRTFAVVIDRNVLRDLNVAKRIMGDELGKNPAEIERHYTKEETREFSVQRCLGLLAPQLGMSLATLRSEIGDAPRGEVVVMKELSEEKAKAVKNFVKEHSLAGVYVRDSLRRLHLFPDLAVHVLGFTNSENVGVEGVEKCLNPILNGVPGRQWYEREPSGGEVLSTQHSMQPAQAGRSVRLTLDLQVQRLLEAELDAEGDDEAEVYVPGLRARGVTVILMDPSTHSIVALANRPHHTLDNLGSITPNRAVSETFEPGSTFKLGAYLGALDSQLIGLATPLNLHGGTYQKGEIRIRDDHPIDGATVLSAFAQSSNIGAYKIAAQLGAARYHGYLSALGFGRRTGVEIPNEATGRLRPPSQWGTLSLRSISFGYEVNVTPMQLVNAYCTVVNDGVARTPRLVEAVLDENGQVVEERPPGKGTKVCSPTAARQLRTAMEEVVMKGTAKKAAIPGFRVGGKTGTAQKYVPARKAYAENAYVVSFVGYVESAAGPELVGVVVIDDADVPSNLEYGGHLAAPLFRRIAGKVLALRGIEPNPEWMPAPADDR
jgi:cell division protein FtsI/penicillin-binding protein 2